MANSLSHSKWMCKYHIVFIPKYRRKIIDKGTELLSKGKLRLAYRVLLGAISEKFDTIVEFSAFHDFFCFERKGKNKVKRVENHKIKVTIEVDMVCGAVK